MRHQLFSSARNTILRQRINRSTVLQSSSSLTRHISSTPHPLTERKPIQQTPKSHAASQAINNNNGDLPAFSFNELGISKNMKIFLIAILSIFGTIETWFWCKAIWHWWRGESKDGAETS